jgi:hypothetical protein
VSQKGWGEAYTQSGFALRILVHIHIQRQTRTSNQNSPCSALSLSNAHSNFAHSGPGQPSSTSILFHALCQGAVACTHYFRASVAVEQSNCVAISKTNEIIVVLKLIDQEWLPMSAPCSAERIRCCVVGTLICGR